MAELMGASAPIAGGAAGTGIGAGIGAAVGGPAGAGAGAAIGGGIGTGLGGLAQLALEHFGGEDARRIDEDENARLQKFLLTRQALA